MQLRPYQVEAVAFLQDRKKALLALPPGAGKTAIVASALPGRGHNLVVAPNGPVLQHWQNEIERWSGLAGHIGTGTPKKRAEARECMQYGSCVLILNYETFRRDIEHLAAIEWDAVVFDESHRLKNRQSQTFKAAQKLKHVERIYLVTGTPVLNRASELWTSLHLMDPAKYRSFWRWAEAFFQISYPQYRRRIVRQVGDIKSAEHARLLRKELKVRMFYRPLKEILPELPEVTETYYEVELSAAERTAYDEMVTNAWMEVGDELIQAPNAIAKMTRLRQLASDWSAWGEPPGTKCQTVCELVEELDQPCVVFVAYRGTARALEEILPNAKAYHGGLQSLTRANILDDFKAGKVQTLVATIATLGEGVDGLQHAAHTAIFLDRDWTPARNDQAVARLRRQGQKDSVNVIHVVARDTVDDIVNQALRDKRDVVAAVIEQRESKDAVHQH